MELLNNVHTMKVMYRICCADDLYFVRENSSSLELLPLPAKAELRSIARMALESTERKVLEALDKCLASKKVPEDEMPAIWAALWQLMFLYRDLLRNRAPWSHSAVPLLNAVAVFYSSYFRTAASLKLSMGTLRGSWTPQETQQAALTTAFDHALGLRDTLRTCYNSPDFNASSARTATNTLGSRPKHIWRC